MAQAAALQPSQLLGWQTTQHKHDTTFHDDIATMDLTGRLKHDALHFGKYVGRFYEHGTANSPRIRQTVIDTALMALGAANALRLNLMVVMHANVPALTEENVIGTLAIPMGRLCSAVEKLDHLEPGGPSMNEAVLDIILWVLGAAKLYGIDDLNTAMAQRRAEISASRFYIDKPPIL
ncbi:MAG: hypothetical protein EOP36_20510 [Rubrivivax sp.]|nr:MAG: hypothetical protein EOP36_20510 [Rubrivivax sp.]